MDKIIAKIKEFMKTSPAIVKYGVVFLSGVTVAILALYVFGAVMINKVNPDAFLEQQIEKVIEDCTGIDLDLSPEEVVNESN
jgi:hypothetical protein